MINKIVLKDSYWRTLALSICNDKMLADDIVQEMYLKLFHIDKEVNDAYVYRTIYTLYIDYLRKSKKTIRLEDYNLKAIEEIEVDDDLLELTNSLKWWEIDLIELSKDLSYREIEKEYNVNYQFARRVVIKARNKWEEIKRK